MGIATVEGGMPTMAASGVRESVPAGEALPPAERARIEGGYGGPDGLDRFARRMRVSRRYARWAELHGGVPFVYVERASAVLRCDPAVFDIRRDPRQAIRKKTGKNRRSGRGPVGTPEQRGAERKTE